jgi:hypothetical protein
MTPWVGLGLLGRTQRCPLSLVPGVGHSGNDPSDIGTAPLALLSGCLEVYQNRRLDLPVRGFDLMSFGADDLYPWYPDPTAGRGRYGGIPLHYPDSQPVADEGQL